MRTVTGVILVAFAMLNGGCDPASKSNSAVFASPVEVATINEVVIYDSEERTHPSPKDSRWHATNRVVTTRISLLVRGVNDGPPPTCPTMGKISLVSASNVTNWYSIPHIHAPDSIWLIGAGGEYIVHDSEALLRQLADLGVPTNKLFAPSVND